jgi:hypothetical protein
VPPDYRRATADRWLITGQPPLSRLASYTAQVFKVDLLYYLGIHRGFISGERASNKADMAYVYYLPFTTVFVSHHKLHHRTVPLFLKRDQSYLDGDELKNALRELDEHYDGLPDKIKQRGVFAFAAYPPSNVGNAVTRLWDTHMHPDWRERAASHEAALASPRDEEADRQTLAELNQRLDAAQLVPNEAANPSGDERDYMVISRRDPRDEGQVADGLEGGRGRGTEEVAPHGPPGRGGAIDPRCCATGIHRPGLRRTGL